MRLEGIHHVTCITGDAPGNVDFYTRVLGLRMVKKTVNQDDPTVYHLFYADEEGSPGADITFFEYPGARRGRPGAGMVHTITFRVGSDESLDFWEGRLGAEGISTRRGEGRLGFDDPEGLGLELAVVETTDAPLIAVTPRSRRSIALQGFDGVRAFAADPEASSALLEGTLGFSPGREQAWEVRGAVRGGHYAYDPPPASGPGSRAPAPCTTSRGPRTWTSRRHGSSACRAAGARAACDRPVLVPLDLLPRAERRPVRDRDARARASRSTRTRSTSARRSSCRLPSSTCAPRSSPC